MYRYRPLVSRAPKQLSKTSEHWMDETRSLCCHPLPKRGVFNEIAKRRLPMSKDLPGRLQTERPVTASINTGLRTGTHAAMVGYFDRQAPEWTLLYNRSRYFRTRLQTVMRWVTNHPPGLEILDYGCGSGVLLKQLAEAGHVVTGVDVSPEMLGFARKTLQSAGIASNRFNLENIPQNGQGEYLNDLYNGIISLGVLEYLDDPLALLEKLLQCLRQDGFLILSLPNKHSFVRAVQRSVEAPALRIIEHSGFLQRLFPRLAGRDFWFKYQKHHFNLGGLELFLANQQLKREKVFYHGAPRLLTLGERHWMVGHTLIAEFRATRQPVCRS
jgi:2-polyprenyl-3-methyl-5-hydroxy-6-metoxy-1,4-benzoquinol methylase